MSRTPKISLLEDYKASGSFDLVDSGLSQSQANAVSAITELMLSLEAETHPNFPKLLNEKVHRVDHLSIFRTEYEFVGILLVLSSARTSRG